jgi:hypothetical protein
VIRTRCVVEEIEVGLRLVLVCAKLGLLARCGLATKIEGVHPIMTNQQSPEPQPEHVNYIPGYGVIPDPQPARQESVRVSRDRAQYVRQQKGHSLTLHLLLGVFVLWIPAVYISVSPNHYWHA